MQNLYQGEEDFVKADMCQMESACSMYVKEAAAT